MKRKYKIQQEFSIYGDKVYCGYKYFLWIFPLYIDGSISTDKKECERKIYDYNYCLKPWKRIFWL